jgi:DNA-binding CsgD family transcriptional regulator/predicted ester cyclase
MQQHSLEAIDYKSLVSRWTAEVWNQRRDDTIEEMLARDCQIEVEGMPGTIGYADFKHYRDAFLLAVPDLVVHIESITTEGETSMQCWRAVGTHGGPGLGIPPTGRAVDFTGASYYQFRGRQIVRGFDRWNRGELLGRLLEVQVDELRARLPLTRREAQVAILMAERLTHGEIAFRLGMKPNTARRHSERVLVKLGINRRQEIPQALGLVTGSILKEHGADLHATVEA